MTMNIPENKQTSHSNDDLCTTISALINRITQLSSQYEENVSKFSQVNGLYDDSVELKKRFDRLLQDYETQINKGSEKIQKNDSAVREIKKNTEQLQKKFQESQEDIKKLSEYAVTVSNFENRKKDIEKEVDDLSSLMKITQIQLSERLEQSTELRDSLTKMKEHFDSVFKSCNEQIENEAKKIQKNYSAIQEIETDIRTLDKKFDVHQKDIENLEKYAVTVNHFENRKEDIEKEINNLSNSVKITQSEILEQKTKFLEQTKQLSELQDSLISKEKYFNKLFANCDKEISKCSQRIQESYSSIQEINTGISTLAKKFDMYEKDIEKLGEYATTIRNFENRKKDIEKDLNKLSELSQITTNKFCQQQEKIAEFESSEAYKFILNNNSGDIMWRLTKYIIDHVETAGMFSTQLVKK